MSELISIPNHTVDPETGFIVSLAYDDAFTPEKKLRYLELFESSGGLICRTAYELGMNDDTVRKHIKIDPEFAKRIQLAKQRANEKVEGVLYARALDPRGSFDRAVWLRNNFREKYGEQQQSNSQPIQININGDLLIDAKSREKMIEARVVKEIES